jgi:hypothetical protein
VQRHRLKVGNPGQTRPPRAAVFEQFDGADDEDLANGRTALSASDRLVFGPADDGRLVDLHDAAERVAVRVHHGAAELVAHEPSGLVAAQLSTGVELPATIGVQ